MNKCLLRFVAIFLALIVLVPYASASELSVVYFDDGSYLEIEVHTIDSRANGTRSGSKTYTYKGSSGEVKWQAVLTGTFTYTGTSATCTASICNVTIYESCWYVVSKTAGKSGVSATGEVTMGYKVLGITTKRVPISMTLTCSANGTLS